MIQGSAARRKRDRKSALWGFVLFGLVVVILGAVFFWKATGESDVLAENLCPAKTGPAGHVILLVDKTDALTFTQTKAFNQVLENFSRMKYVGERELLSVFVLDEDFRGNAEPIFEKCNPGNGSNRSRITDNPELWNRKYQNDYVKPLLSTGSQLRSMGPAKYSPILEMLQLVALRFEKYDVRGSRKLYIVSDMLHNTQQLSLFGGVPEFESLKNKPIFSRLRASLKEVDVTIFLLLFSPQLQTRKLSKFWEDYITEMGGKLQQINSFPG